MESTKAIESATDILIQIKAAARRGGKVSTVTVYYPEASCTAGRAPFTQRKDTDYMNGAQALFKALTEAGLDICLANRGTSEMQLLCEMGRTENVSAVALPGRGLSLQPRWRPVNAVNFRCSR